MADIVDTSTRSRMMSNIRSRDTKPEMLLRTSLHARGFRYKLHGVSLPGRPDLVFPGRRAVCFVHGCFWHRHRNCRFTTTPGTRTDFWLTKFAGNVERDNRNVAKLRAAGWRVCIVWGCSLRRRNFPETLQKVERWLCSEQDFMELEVLESFVQGPV